MSGTQGPTPPPPDRPEGDAAPPYPGWSTEQPKDPGWGAPADAPPTWKPPTTSSTTGSTTGWKSHPGTSWGVPDAKPGVIPLRPLGVGEILDGAVTTIRRNPAAMLGLSAVVAVISQLIGLVASWALFDDLATLEQLGGTADPEQVLNAMSGSFAALGVTSFVTWLGTVFLTGVLTIVVGRAVLGEHLTASAAWRVARGRLLRLFGLTLLYTLIWAGALIGLMVVGALLALVAGDAAAALVIVGMLVAVPLAVWLYVRYSLAGPALMLETTSDGVGGSRPLRVIESFRRSAELVRTSWWRVFGILVLVTIIVWIITQVIAVPFNIPTLFGSGGLGADISFGSLVVAGLGAIIGATFTAPFSAGATALLYIDRRIRREGLDIELARAAGVELPGRPGQPDGPVPGNR